MCCLPPQQLASVGASCEEVKPRADVHGTAILRPATGKDRTRHQECRGLVVNGSSGPHGRIPTAHLERNDAVPQSPLSAWNTGRDEGTEGGRRKAFKVVAAATVLTIGVLGTAQLAGAVTSGDKKHPHSKKHHSKKHQHSQDNKKGKHH